MLQVQCLVHSYQLSKDVRRTDQIRRKTHSFAKILHEQDGELSEKERTRNRKLDVESIHLQCSTEQSRWERNWPTIKNEWILDSIRSQISPIPLSTHFFSQDYHTAFHNPQSSNPASPTSVIQSSTRTVENNISNLLTTQSLLTSEITRLESLLQTPSPSPRKSSLRKSLPTAPSLTPSTSPSRTHGLKFSRSSSRLSHSESTSPRTMAAKHCGSPARRWVDRCSGDARLVEECVEGARGGESAGTRGGERREES